MKRVKRILATAALAIAAVMTTSTVTLANAGDQLIEKARKELKAAAPDNWEIRAKWAQKMIAKGKHLKDAKAWIERSMEIKETAMNTEIMGDYYMANKLPNKAITYYLKSSDIRKNIDGSIEVDEVLQEKMYKAAMLRHKLG